MNASVPQPGEEGSSATAQGDGPRDGVRVEPLSDDEQKDLANRLVQNAMRRMSPAELHAFKIRGRSERPELRACAYGMVNGALSRGIAWAPNRS